MRKPKYNFPIYTRHDHHHHHNHNFHDYHHCFTVSNQVKEVKHIGDGGGDGQGAGEGRGVQG